MAEFDDKLNSLLSNPEAMDQIMKMAQSLMGNDGRTEQPPPAAPPSGKTENTVQNGGGTFQQKWPRQRRDGAELGPAQPGKPKPGSQRAGGDTVSRGLARVSSPDWVIWIPRPSPPSCRSSGSWERPRTATPVSFYLHCGPI